MTIISFNKQTTDIGNLLSLPPEIVDEIESSEQIVVRGFQELYGLKNVRQMFWSAGGHWTGRSASDKFIVTSYGSKRYQWDGQTRTLRKACHNCGVFQ